MRLSWSLLRSSEARAERESRFSVFAIALLAIGWGIAMLIVEATGGTSSQASRVSWQDALRPLAPSDHVAAGRADEVVWSCRPDVVATATNVRIDQLLAAGPGGLSEDGADALRDTARRAASATVQCAPLDSAGWLLVAMTRGSHDPSGGAARGALELSYWTGSLDPALLMRRIVFVDRFVAAGGRDFERPLRDDINRLLEIGADEVVALMYRDGTPALRQRLRTAIFRLNDPIRRAAHTEVFDRLDAANR